MPCCKTVVVDVISDDDRLSEVKTSLTDADEVIAGVSSSQSAVNSLSAELNDDGTESSIGTLMAFCE